MKPTSQQNLLLALFVSTFTTQAFADHVLLLPAEGPAPLRDEVTKEARLVLVELGHSLVSDERVQAGLHHVRDGRVDDAEEFALVAQSANAQWVLTSILYPGIGAHRLEMTAFQASSGRTESVSRDIDPTSIHNQLREVAAVLLRDQGVGTEALPWERSAPPTAETHAPSPEQGSPSTLQPEGQTKGLRPLVGLSLGSNTAISRPSEATGSSTAMHGGARLGLELSFPLELALDFQFNLSGPKATMLDASARYWFPVVQGFRLAPQLAPGVFFMGGGAQNNSFFLKLSAVGALELTQEFSIEAQVGDITWIPASAGTVLLGGATLSAVARF